MASLQLLLYNHPSGSKTMEIIGSTITGSNLVSNSPQGAIEGENGILLLQGYITFENNSGVNGGAISLSNNVPVYCYDNCKVNALQNIVTEYGGLQQWEFHFP